MTAYKDMKRKKRRREEKRLKDGRRFYMCDLESGVDSDTRLLWENLGSADAK